MCRGTGESDSGGRYSGIHKDTADNTGKHTFVTAIFSAYKAGRESSGDNRKHGNHTEKPEIRDEEKGESRNGKSRDKQKYNA